MSNIQHSVPTVGNWYDSENFQESFIVIDCDKNDGIEIQYKDGELDKIETSEDLKRRNWHVDSDESEIGNKFIKPQHL